MPNVSIKTLTDVLEKSGLPFDSAVNMQNTAPLSRDVIASQVSLPDFGGDELKTNFRAQLDRIAQMDKKLSSLYGDPSSSLFIENPLARERLKSTPATTGYKVSSNIAQTYQTRKVAAEKEQEQIIDEAVSLYSKLATLQAKEEARIAREQKAATKGAKKSTSQKVADSVVRSQELRKQKLALTGITDPDAIAVYERAPVDFQQQWVREYQQAVELGEASPEENFYTADDIKGAWSAWDEKTKKPKAKDANKIRL